MRITAASLFQYALLGVLLLVLIMDGVALQLLSLVAPLLLSEWGLEKDALGPAFSAALVGMAVGALFGGWAGDQIGRKALLVGSVVCFGISTAALAFSHSLVQMTWLRLLGGLGFGAVGPASVALSSEWLRGRLRIRAIPLMSVGPPLGGMVGAIVLVGLLSLLGWRGAFLACGAATFLVVLVTAAVVPESAAFLESKGGSVRIPWVLRRWRGWNAAPESPQPDSSRPPMSVDAAETVVETVSARFVFASSAAFFCVSYVAYAFIAWTPLVLTSNGIALNAALGAVVWFNVCAVLAAAATGSLVQPLGSRALMVSGVVIAGLASLLLMHLLGTAQCMHGSWCRTLLAPAAGLIGFGSGVVISTIYVVIVVGYPVARRATGLGLGMMLGRAGGVVGSYLGGRLLGNSPGQVWAFFLAVGLALLGTCASILLINRHIPAKP